MQKLRFILLPFSYLYGVIIYFRNLLYDIGIFKVYHIPKKSICVGNLAVGGTGKSPHVNYLVDLFKSTLSISIISRGYGRKTKGFILANEHSLGSEIGDEPKMYVTRYLNQIRVAVCEKRYEAVQKINNLFPDNQLIILDDAFQHRAVKAGLNILLTDYNSIFYKDLVLPAGNLREWKSGRKRANIIIVTKCPTIISAHEKTIINKKLKFNSNQIFYSFIKYGELISFFNLPIPDFQNVLLVTGIANPKPLIEKLEKGNYVKIISFPDHYNYTIKDIERIHQIFDTFAAQKKVIITTEKDFMRFSELIEKTNMRNYPWFYQSIDIEIDKKEIFNKLITDYAHTI